MNNHGTWPATRSTLLVKLRDTANDHAWRRFIDLYGLLVFRYCRRSGCQNADAEEITQDVLVQVWQSMKTFCYDRRRGGFHRWLGTVTHNRIKRQWKTAARRDDVVSDSTPSQSPHDTTLWDEMSTQQLLRLALTRVRQCFETATWDAFELAWLENRPALDVARQLQMPIDRVYVSKSRVLKRLEVEVMSLSEDMPLPL
jgi:RNA polymerase sigma-70 factor (ECF subfamily)